MVDGQTVTQLDYFVRGDVLPVDDPIVGRLHVPGFFQSTIAGRRGRCCLTAILGHNREIFIGRLGLSESELEELVGATPFEI